MKIVEFLLANYHWILAIILLTIITIIGFLADKKKNDKKKDVEPISNKQQDKNKIAIKQQPMQYQPGIENQMDEQQNNMQNNMNNISKNENLNQNQQDNGLMNQMHNYQNPGTIPQPISFAGEIQNNNNLINNPQPVENIVPETVQEPIYQPLEEQKPHFTTQPISFGGEIQNQPPQMINNQMPLENKNAMNQQPMIQAIPQNMNMGQQIKKSEPMMQLTNFNQNNNMQNNNNYGMMNTIPNQVTTPQPVNPIPVPTPIIPQPIMTNQMPTYNMNNQIPNQNAFVGNLNPQQSMMQANQQQMQTPITPVNFVYGPQNNNQNM